MLNHHPEIDFIGEFELCVDCIGPNGELPELPAYHEWLSLDRHFRHYGLQIDPQLDYAGLVQNFLAQLHARSAGSGKPHVGVTVHRRFDQLLRFWPDALFIHLVRDPRDVGVSWLQRGWHGNLWMASQEWRKLETLWDRVRLEIPAERRIELRFEDLVTDAPACLAHICELIGTPYSDAMLSYPEDSTYGPVDASEVEKWRERLSDRELQHVDIGAGEMLAARGYPSSGLPPRVIGPMGARALRLHSRLNALRNRIRKIGMRIWLEDKLARMLKIRAWQQSVASRRHIVVNKQLK
jgi:hypothetical protein